MVSGHIRMAYRMPKTVAATAPLPTHDKRETDEGRVPIGHGQREGKISGRFVRDQTGCEHAGKEWNEPLDPQPGQENAEGLRARERHER